MESVQTEYVLESSVVRRAIPLHRLSGVSRNLFGSVDHDQLSRELNAKLREISEQDKCRWNFNFETNTPLVGRYQWEEVPLNASPALYQELTHVEGDERENVDFTGNTCTIDNAVSTNEETLSFSTVVNQENCFNISNTATPSPVIQHKRKPHPNNNNRQITDFFVKRKRTSEMKSTYPNSPPAIPIEKTPSKRIR